MKQRYKILLLGLSCLFNSAIYAQQKGQATISGKIRDRFGKPIESASVLVKHSERGTASEIDGFYKLTDLRSGETTLEVRAVGFATQTKALIVEEDKNVVYDFVLNEENSQLEEVAIMGKSENLTKVQEIRQSGFNVNVVDLNQYANMATDINQVLKRTTGVLVRENGGMGSDFTFQINGLAAKIYIDDIPMDQYGSSMTLNNIPVNLVDRVEVYKGVVPAHLGGDAMGGAVNIITKQRTRKFLDASYSFGSFNTHQAAITGGARNQKTGLKVRASAYYNYSDNNYVMYSDPTYNIALKVIQQDPTTGDYRQMDIDRARRFHDRYRSTMGELELGFEKVRWADWFTFGLTYTANDKQNQLGATLNSVYGGNWRTNRYFMPAVKYRKDDFLIKGLYANIYANYSQSRDNSRDTALYRYDWSGHWGENWGGTPIEEIYNRIDDKTYTTRSNFNYHLDGAHRHSLNLNYSFSTTNRHTYDLTETDLNRKETSGLPSRLGKHILGLAWQGQWLNKKLISVTSFKYYGMDTKVSLDERTFDEYGRPVGGQIRETKKFFSYPSGSLALRYLITPDFGIKGSLERGYNLPEATALFGDGQFINANFNLRPERSDNLNFGTYYNHFLGDHFINFDVSAFYRDSKDYIASWVLEDNIHSQSQNFPGVRLYGFEAEAKYGFKDMLSLSINGSYDRAKDNWKYTDESNSQISLTYQEQLPNRPWIYGNADLMLAKRDLLGKGTRIQLNYLYQYIHWFYLTWEKLGSPGTLNYVPTQTIHSAVLTYSWMQDRYNLSFEARNLTDERAYDNFRLQKPGRAFYIKLRLSLM